MKYETIKLNNHEKNFKKYFWIRRTEGEANFLGIFCGIRYMEQLRKSILNLVKTKEKLLGTDTRSTVAN